MVAICLAAAALHLVTGPGYRGPFRAFVTGYLIDLVLPFAMVLLLGLGLERATSLGRPAVRAIAVVLFGAVVELLQYLGVPLFGRTADLLDIGAYALGAAAAVGFERWAWPAAG